MCGPSRLGENKYCGADVLGSARVVFERGAKACHAHEGPRSCFFCLLVCSVLFLWPFNTSRPNGNLRSTRHHLGTAQKTVRRRFCAAFSVVTVRACLHDLSGVGRFCVSGANRTRSANCALLLLPIKAGRHFFCCDYLRRSGVRKNEGGRGAGRRGEKLERHCRYLVVRGRLRKAPPTNAGAVSLLLFFPSASCARLWRVRATRQRAEEIKTGGRFCFYFSLPLPFRANSVGRRRGAGGGSPVVSCVLLPLLEALRAESKRPARFCYASLACFCALSSPGRCAAGGATRRRRWDDAGAEHNSRCDSPSAVRLVAWGPGGRAR